MNTWATLLRRFRVRAWLTGPFSKGGSEPEGPASQDPSLQRAGLLCDGSGGGPCLPGWEPALPTFSPLCLWTFSPSLPPGAGYEVPMVTGMNKMRLRGPHRGRQFTCWRPLWVWILDAGRIHPGQLPANNSSTEAGGVTPWASVTPAKDSVGNVWSLLWYEHLRTHSTKSWARLLHTPVRMLSVSLSLQGNAEDFQPATWGDWTSPAWMHLWGPLARSLTPWDDALLPPGSLKHSPQAQFVHGCPLFCYLWALAGLASSS